MPPFETIDIFAGGDDDVAALITALFSDLPADVADGAAAIADDGSLALPPRTAMADDGVMAEAAADDGSGKASELMLELRFIAACCCCC